jgi:hypothetical protein
MHLHQSMIYEDNTGCLELVNKPDQFQPQPKHIRIKWYHFQDTLKNGSIMVKKIDTTYQLADPLIKPLPQHWFEMLQHLLMGWLTSCADCFPILSFHFLYVAFICFFHILFLATGLFFSFSVFWSQCTRES